jgi:formamidopyrimidine-DNA glycosylase
VPELPEVETLLRGLQPKALGQKVAGVKLTLKKLLVAAPPEGLGALQGKKVLGLRRRAKHLLIDFEAGLTLGVHLGMSGQLTYWSPEAQDAPGFMRHRHTGLQKTAGQHAPDKHTHCLVYFESGQRLQYRDPRQFGRLRLFVTSEEMQTEPYARLGPEPLDKAFTPRDFYMRLQQHRCQLKPLIMNQRFLSGIGNIYADEGLFLAGLHPCRLAHKLSPAQANALLKSLRKVLQKGIANGGSSIADFIGADGQSGSNQDSLQVYGRSQEPCPRCGKILKHLVVAQRSTVVCAHCQK